MKKMIIAKEDLKKFMTEENYIKFIKDIKERSKYEDYDTIEDEPIFIIAEWD